MIKVLRSPKTPFSLFAIGWAALVCYLIALFGTGFMHAHAAASATVNAPLVLESADRFADGVASVNAPICTNPDAFGPTQTAAARAELAYLAGYRFRHVRDGFLKCYHEIAYLGSWRFLAAHGAKLLATELFSYTDEDLRSAHQRLPALEALSAGNEWDVESVDELLGRDAESGDTTVTTRPFGLGLHMVAGQTYRFEDDEPETFTLVKTLTHDTASIQSPLRFSHRIGTKISRVGDFVSDINFWMKYYTPRFRAMRPPLPVLGASLAFPIHSESFSIPTDRTDGRFGLDAVEEHGYPAPMGSNPEGSDGDGKRSYISIDHPPCSFARTSYSMGFNSCEAQRQTGVPGLPIWETEYSYQVVPNGAAPLPGTPHPIPDSMSILYLARSEFFAAAQGRTRLYWFQMLDGTDGPKSGFCSYGLIYTGQCGEDSPIGRPKGELLALGNIISFFRDDNCLYPTCTLKSSEISVRWSDPSLPLNTSAFQWKSGKLAIVAWLGEKSYDFAGMNCASTSTCFTKNVPRSERLYSLAMEGRRVNLRTFDANPSDPMPPQNQVQSADGTMQTIAACPSEPRRKFYGCLTPAEPMRVENGTVFLDVSDDPAILTIEP